MRFALCAFALAVKVDELELKTMPDFDNDTNEDLV
jgi:phage-related minor tail protein